MATVPRLPDHVLPDLAPRTRFVRVTSLTPHLGTRQHTLVRVQHSPLDDEAVIFACAVREYRILHGGSEPIVAIDLRPGE